jgi:hypothetical protein
VTVAPATRVIVSAILLAGVIVGGSSSAARASTQLTATTPTGRIVIARGDGSGRRVLGDGWASFVSPDGARVAVTDFDQTSVGPTNQTLKLFATSGGPPAHVLAIDCLGVYWSPDSKKLACVDHGVPTGDPRPLLVIDAASGSVTTVATGYIDSRVSFSPNSARLAYAQSNRDASKSGGALKAVNLARHTTATLRQGAAAPVWGPRAIAFSTVKPGGPYGVTLNVAVVKPDGTGFRRLTRFRPRFLQSGLSPIAWSSNGRRLLAALGGQDTWQAYAVDPKRGGARAIRAFVTPAALSRDGRFVIGGDNTEASDDPGRSNVVRVPWAGGKARVLLHHAGSPSFNG